MNNPKLQNLLFLLFFGFTSTIYSQNKEIPLWETIPGSIESVDYKENIIYDNDGVIKGIDKVSQPTLTQFLADPEKSNGTAVIICPGGGYGHLAINKEGYKVAKWFNSLGISAFVLKYRLPSDLTMKDKSIGPLQDAQEAVRMIRRNANKWHLDSAKIGIMGFSAGGHLAATLSTHYLDKVYDSKDNVSARPDFSILIYPVISMEDGITHNGSKVNLLGANASKEMADKYSNEKQVDSNTPKAFLVHATDDKTVPVENTINYYLALKEHNVLGEMHVYEKGGHGFGLGVEGTHKEWPKACEKWLLANGFMKNP
jgi:acetyl esterase/lipase